MKTTNLRLPITAMGIALGLVVLLFLPQALSVEARTSDESITGLTLASEEPGILIVTWDAVDPPPGDHRVNWAKAGEEFPSWVALLFLSQAPSVEARTSDESIIGLTLTSGEPGSLTVSWDAVDPPPGDYRVNWAKAGEEFPSWQECNGNAFPASSSYTVFNLEPGVEYKVRVRARYFDGSGNRVRSGPWSDLVRLQAAANPASTPTATPTPTTQAGDSIAGLTLTSGEPGILTVTWNAADPPPGDYRVNWAKAGEEFPSWQECDGNAFLASSSYTVSNLEPGVEYKVRVRARYFDGSGNRVRSGPWSGSPSLTVAAQTAATLQDSDEDAGRQPNAREVLLRQDTDGRAVAIAGATDADFSGVPPSVTFYSGETSKSFTVSATDDSVDDDGESLTLRFGVLPARVSAGTNSESTVNIDDDDVPEITVTYAQASYTVAEGSTVIVKVALSADPQRTLTIPISVTHNGGAVADDYTGLPASLTFNAGETGRSFAFSAVQDTIDDDDESVTLTFGALPARVSAGTNSESTVGIADDDVPEITVTFAQASYTVAEGGIITVTVTLSADPERTVTIPITHTN